MIIEMEPGFREHLISYCLWAAPREACGFVVGEAAPSRLLAQKIVAVANTAVKAEKEFAMDEAEVVQALFSIPSDQLLGIFHSHPRTPAIPSQADLRTAWHTLPSFWIVSLTGGNPELTVYRLIAPHAGAAYCSAERLQVTTPKCGGAS